ncbi:MAG: hypothetical protein POELPBGB_02045 [Bacteroidia bacterium]|nr:hypothetical protein [Bacteroidia bacterium]
MKTQTPYFLLLLLLASLVSFTACKKDNDDDDNNNNPSCGIEVEIYGAMGTRDTVYAYLFEDYNGIPNYSAVVPYKIQVDGGSPSHATGDYSFSVANLSALPFGVALDEQTGVLKNSGGTLVPGLHPFTINVSDGTCSVDRTLYMRVTFVPANNSIPWPLFQFDSFVFLDHAEPNKPYGSSLCLMGGEPPYQFFMIPGSGSMPPGLSLGASNGVISGTVFDNAAGIYEFRVGAVDAAGDTCLGTGGIGQNQLLKITID